MKIYLGDNKSKNDKVAIKHIRKYLRQLELALKDNKVDIKEFEINNHLDEIGNGEVNMEYNPTGRRTLTIIYYDKEVKKNDRCWICRKESLKFC